MSPSCCSGDKNVSGHGPEDTIARLSSETDCCAKDDDVYSKTECASSCESLKFDVCNSQEELCNEKCIIAAAAAECAKLCEDDDAHDVSCEHQHVHDTNGDHPVSACSSHLTKAFEQYKAYLETARCICLSVLDRGLPSTHCSEQYNHTAREAEESAGIHAHSTAHGLYRHQPGGRHKHGNKLRHRGNKAHTRHGDVDEITTVSKQDDHGGCCSGHEHSSEPYEKGNKAISNIKKVDIEKDSGLEHVVLNVSGMTCSGCGNKMERTLKAAPGVTNVRVNFVMGSAEFSLDSSTVDASHVIKDVERATGFQCTRLAGSDQSIDVLASGATVKALLDLVIPGVTDVTILSKRAVRVSYDPTVIGGRDLFDAIKDKCDGLAPPADDPSVSSGRKHMYDLLIKTFIAAILTIPVVVLAWGDDLVDQKTRAYVSIVLATFVQIIAIPVFYQPAIKTLIHDRSLEMDMLVTISITAAYVYSIVAFGFRMANQPLETSEFFETSTLLITLVLLGRLVAAFARIRAVAAVSLRSLQSSTALIVENGKEKEIDARLLQYGDRFKVLPNSRIPTDGVIVNGSSEVDESMLTGESVPVTKQPGDHVIAGTVNGSGILEAQLTRLPGRNTVTDIAELVEEAANSKPKIQDLADRVASWFVPVVTSVAIIVTIVWIVVGLKVRNESTNKAVANAITYAVAVLAVSCPCALGLAVPMVLVVAGGLAARGGVVIKSADCTARSYKVTDIVFDKTGTLTESDLSVVDEEYFDIDRDEAIGIVKALVGGNKHPVSSAVASHLEKNMVRPATIENVKDVPGAGVEAISSTGIFRAGNPRWTNNETLPSVATFLQSGMTTLLITCDSTPIALFGLRASLRPEATAVIAKLKQRNINLHIVSGDQTHAVNAVATAVGIDPQNVASHHSPAQKREYVASLMGPNKLIMFCGDGTNDAIAVAQADVGIQLGGSLSSSDVTRGAADVVLLAGLEGIPFLVDVSRAAFHRMFFNFVWSGVYNVLAILLAAGAFVNVRIPPAYAGLGEIVSVLPVVFAAMTMLVLEKQKA